MVTELRRVELVHKEIPDTDGEVRRQGNGLGTKRKDIYAPGVHASHSEFLTEGHGPVQGEEPQTTPRRDALHQPKPLAADLHVAGQLARSDSSAETLVHLRYVHAQAEGDRPFMRGPDGAEVRDAGRSLEVPGTVVQYTIAVLPPGLEELRAGPDSTKVKRAVRLPLDRRFHAKLRDPVVGILRVDVQMLGPQLDKLGFSPLAPRR